MDKSDCQRLLNHAGYNAGHEDGIFGRKTFAAADRAIEALAPSENVKNVGNKRRVVMAAQLILADEGFAEEVRRIDGYIGTMTGHAFDLWAYREQHGELPDPWRPDDVEADGPDERAVPDWGTQRDMRRRFGEPGGPQCTAGKVIVPPEFGMVIAWNKRKAVRRFSCHEDIADALTRVYAKALSDLGPDLIQTLGLHLWGGCYNYRKKRGGSTLSTHAYGLAVDHDPERNQLRWKVPRARLSRPDAVEWWRIVESEGFTSLGRARDFDWMHFQAPGL